MITLDSVLLPAAFLIYFFYVLFKNHVKINSTKSGKLINPFKIVLRNSPLKKWEEYKK